MAVLEMENVFPMGFVNVKMDTLELIAQQVIQKFTVNYVQSLH